MLSAGYLCPNSASCDDKPVGLQKLGHWKSRTILSVFTLDGIKSYLTAVCVTIPFTALKPDPDPLSKRGIAVQYRPLIPGYPLSPEVSARDEPD